MKKFAVAGRPATPAVDADRERRAERDRDRDREDGQAQGLEHRGAKAGSCQSESNGSGFHQRSENPATCSGTAPR